MATMERVFTSLADRTRLRLLNLMAEREVCVCFFVGVLDAPQPTVSRHLAYLRRNGMVKARREGKWMHYRVAVHESVFALKLLADALRWLAEDEDMKRDRERLAILRQLAEGHAVRSGGRACCSPKRLKTLRRAPQPMLAAKLTHKRYGHE